MDMVIAGLFCPLLRLTPIRLIPRFLYYAPYQPSPFVPANLGFPSPVPVPVCPLCPGTDDVLLRLRFPLFTTVLVA